MVAVRDRKKSPAARATCPMYVKCKKFRPVPQKKHIGRGSHRRPPSKASKAEAMLAKINVSKPHPPPEFGEFSSAFVLPITRDGRALLTREQRGNDEKFGLLGGKAHSGENAFECMAREANEESAGTLSKATLLRVGRGAGVLDLPVEYTQSGASPDKRAIAAKHDLVAEKMFDFETRFDTKKAALMRTPEPTLGKKRKRQSTVQLGVELVSVEMLRDCSWRNKHMHFMPSVLCARLLKQ